MINTFGGLKLSHPCTYFPHREDGDWIPGGGKSSRVQPERSLGHLAKRRPTCLQGSPTFWGDVTWSSPGTDRGSVAALELHSQWCKPAGKAAGTRVYTAYLRTAASEDGGGLDAGVPSRIPQGLEQVEPGRGQGKEEGVSLVGSWGGVGSRPAADSLAALRKMFKDTGTSVFSSGKWKNKCHQWARLLCSFHEAKGWRAQMATETLSQL